MGRHPAGNRLVSCPYCQAYPFVRSRGLENHIRQQPSCLRARQRYFERLGGPDSQHTSCLGTPVDDDSQLQLDGGGSPSGGSNQAPLLQAASVDRSPTESPDHILPVQPNSESLDDDLGPQSPDRVNPSGPYQIQARDPSHEPQVGNYVGTTWEAKRANEQTNLPFYPWASQAEFQLVSWLSTEGLSQGAIDRYLKLRCVSHN